MVVLVWGIRTGKIIGSRSVFGLCLLVLLSAFLMTRFHIRSHKEFFLPLIFSPKSQFINA